MEYSADQPPASFATLGERIHNRRQELRLTLQKLADRVGCAKSYLSDLENSHKVPGNDDLVAKIEVALSMEPDSLVRLARWERSIAAGGPEMRGEINRLRSQVEANRRLCELIKSGAGGLDAAYRSGELRRLVDAAEEGGTKPFDQHERQPAPVEEWAPSSSRRRGEIAVVLPREVPLINKVAAGYPREFTDLGYPARAADEYVRCPDISDPDAFAARVVGDSMSPEYREGDIVVFSPAKAVKSGDDCFARLERDGETTFKRVYFEMDESGAEYIRLQPINNGYAPRVLRREEVAGLYAAVTAIRKIG